jgi:hypothetical protein
VVSTNILFSWIFPPCPDGPTPDAGPIMHDST